MVTCLCHGQCKHAELVSKMPHAQPLQQQLQSYHLESAPVGNQLVCLQGQTAVTYHQTAVHTINDAAVRYMAASPPKKPHAEWMAIGHTQALAE